MAFQLGKVKIGPTAPIEQFSGVVKKEIPPKSNSEPRHRLAVQQHVLFRQVPPAGAPRMSVAVDPGYWVPQLVNTPSPLGL